mgnify:CR=1 FL=1
MSERCIVIKHSILWNCENGIEKCGAIEAANTGDASGGKQFQEQVYAAVNEAAGETGKRIMPDTIWE